MTAIRKAEVRFPKLERALDILVREAAALAGARDEREVATRVARGGHRFNVIEYDDIEAGPSETEFLDALLLTDPTEAAYRLGIRRIGELLYARLGSEQAMIPTWQCVAYLDRKYGAWRADIINQSWDGIGDWHV
jgi:hypothetical protein